VKSKNTVAFSVHWYHRTDFSKESTPCRQTSWTYMIVAEL